MKMEGVGDVINGRTNEVAKMLQPSPKGPMLFEYPNILQSWQTSLYIYIYIVET